MTHQDCDNGGGFQREHRLPGDTRRRLQGARTTASGHPFIPPCSVQFGGSGGYILFACIVPVVLGFLGLALLFIVSQYADSPTEQIRPHLLAVNTKYEKMKVIDKSVPEIIQLVAAQNTGAPSPDFAVTRYGKTAALPGDSKTTVDADNVANVDAVCEPHGCDLHFRTTGEDSDRPEQLAELAPDSLDGQLDVPSTPPSDDFDVLTDGQGIELPKDPMTTTCKDAAIPEPPNLIFFYGSYAAGAASERPFLICHVRGKDLYRAVVTEITKYCSHLIFSEGDDPDESKRSFGEFVKGAVNRSRLYRTVKSEACEKGTDLTKLLSTMRSLKIDGFEFYLKGNENSITKKACLMLIQGLIKSQGATSVILRSGPYKTSVRPDVLANVYQTHAPVDNNGRMAGACFVNNFDDSSSGPDGSSPFRMKDLLVNAQKERSSNVTAGQRNVTNLCYSFSLLALRLDDSRRVSEHLSLLGCFHRRTVMPYSKLCEKIQYGEPHNRPQKSDKSLSKLVNVGDISGQKYRCSFDDAETLEQKARAVSALTKGALCVAAYDVEGDDIDSHCGPRAPLLSKIAEIARKQNSAIFKSTNGLHGVSIEGNAAMKAAMMAV
ncbi:uncharacterized protein LOC144175620 [Haemaphysalis longicornis]